MVNVEKLDDLQIETEDGQILSQDRIDEHLAYLNGEKLIGGFGTQTTLHRQNQGQRSLTKLKKKIESKGGVWRGNSDETRERRKLLDSLDKQFLQVR